MWSRSARAAAPLKPLSSLHEQKLDAFALVFHQLIVVCRGIRVILANAMR